MHGPALARPQRRTIGRRARTRALENRLSWHRTSWSRTHGGSRGRSGGTCRRGRPQRRLIYRTRPRLRNDHSWRRRCRRRWCARGGRSGSHGRRLRRRGCGPRRSVQRAPWAGCRPAVASRNARVAAPSESRAPPIEAARAALGAVKVGLGVEAGTTNFGGAAGAGAGAFGAGALAAGGAGGTADWVLTGGAAGGASAAAGPCCLLMMAFRASPGLEICERSILVLISSPSGRDRPGGPAGTLCRTGGRGGGHALYPLHGLRENWNGSSSR